MLEQSIGPFKFLALRGQIAPPSERIEVLRRPGINGAAFMEMGRVSEEFVLRSQVDMVSPWHAHWWFGEYLKLKEDDPVPLVKDDVDMVSLIRPFIVKVIDVKMALIEARIGGVGGLNEPSEAWLEADWTLVAVELSSQEKEFV
jgi:hypothetical protein